MKLRDYQQNAIENIRNGILAGHKRQVLQLPTGAGKTAVAAEIARLAHENGKRVWFTVDNLELVDQALEAFQRVGLDCSVIQGTHDLTDYSKAIQIITNQTLVRRWNRFDANPHWLPDLIFHDEAHIQFKVHHQIKGMLPDIPVIGLSATPFSNGLGLLYSNLIVGHTTKELIDEGHLCDFDAYAPFTPDMRGVTTQAGDYNPKESVEKVNQRKIVGNVVTEWKKHAFGRKTIVFACNIAHSEAICKEFVEADINAIHLDGYTDKDERKDIVRRFKEGHIDVLCSVMVLSKGFDAPIASCAVLAAPTKSVMKYLQQVGRVLRTYPGKEKALLLDHSGNIERLGFPTDDFPQFLDNGDKEERAERKKAEKADKLPTPCEKCKALSVEFVCPVCGHVPVKPHNIEQVDGELKKIEKFPPQVKNQWLGMLLGHARKKGYQDGWASWAYKEKFKVWPAKKVGIHAVEPNSEVKKYITYMNIKKAKNKAKYART